MADGENKRADAGDAAEPLLKRARLRDAPGDSEHGAAGDTEPVEAEPEPALMDESHPQASLNNNNNNNLTEPKPEPEPEPEPELSDLTDAGVHPNGFTSPDLPHDDDDDDDCSSHASSSDWTPQPQIGSYRFIQQHIMRGTDPRAILKDLLPETVLPADLDDMTLWQIIINISEPPKRKKRKDVVPHCPRCPSDVPYAIMKPDIIFFGENLPEFFHRAMKQDKDEVDLLIVIGSSLKVRPVALIPSSIPHDVPQVLINREPLPHLNFDVELLGDCDVIVNELCHRLGGDFEQLCYNSSRLSEITEKPPSQSPSTGASADTSLSPEKEEPQTAARRTSPHPEPLPEANSDPKTASPCEATEAPDAPEDLKEEEPADPHRAEVRRRCWRSRICQSPISKRLGASQYLFQAPNRYIFHGAEVYSSSEDESSSSCGSDSDAVDHEDSDAEEEQNTDVLAETVQEREHKRLQTDCTAETHPQTTQ
uniref:Sirtuin 1 n=1 Tax=Cyprinus carpio TaxID=7962 RepID=A0A8C1Y9Z8_CYPCA